MLLYSTKKLLMAFFLRICRGRILYYVFVPHDCCRGGGGGGGGGAGVVLRLKTRADDASFLAGGKSLGASSPGKF